MATTDELTKLVCLFHHDEQASAAVNDLIKSGISQSSISVSGNQGPGGTADTFLQEIGIPGRDQKHILKGLRDGGVLVAVSATAGEVQAVEKVFGKHSATLIDEAESKEEPASPAGQQDAVIPIVEEELEVGKRTVDQGGVRVYRRIVEIPVEESVTLREERVDVQRRAVDRPVTDADLAQQGDRTIELTETAEEAVVAKTARVVEEVLVSKNESERTEHIHDTVRRTEVDIEEVVPEGESTRRRV